MIAFDADVFTDILRGHEQAIASAAQIPAGERRLPIVVVEEILRGRLNAIRQAESGKSRTSIDRAYLLFETTINDLRFVPVLSYSSAAETQFPALAKAKNTHRDERPSHCRHLRDSGRQAGDTQRA